MSVFKKLQEARVRLQEIKMAKSGWNSFAKYHYFQLPDFLPHVQKICKDVGICAVVTFDLEYATMIVYDVDDPTQFIQFKSPQAGVTDTKGGQHPIQGVGSVETYQRRYLYQVAFEISEHDALDPQKPEEADYYADMELATSYDALKRIYAEAYKKARAAGNKAEMDKLKSTYQEHKDRLTKAGAAANDQEQTEAA